MKILGILFLVLFSAAAPAAPEQPAADKVLALARSKKISDLRGWKKLLHIEPNAIGINSRQISDPAFYLSNSKEFENYSEVEATLLAFMQPPEKYERLIEHPLKKNQKELILDFSEHALCRFPARLKFLQAELAEAAEFWISLPRLNCVYQNIFLEAVDPESVSFVFSSYYSDSPGSAFGHTFFRINRKSNKSPVMSAGTRQELLDYGVGYAANVTVSNGALYAVLGLVGGFTGTWTNVPYYYKVREYNNFEARDLWSYDLKLHPDEVDMLALHLWEVGPHYYTYYFFTQNCAFHMLTLLEAAAPRLDLTAHVPFYYVIPSDSMKALFQEKDLVGNVTFRPSIRKVFLERVKSLGPAALSAFKRYAQTEDRDESNLSTQAEKALFLDAAMDLIDLRHPNLGAERGEEYRKKEELLASRAQIDFVSPEIIVKATPDDHPENSHGSSRVGLSYQEKSELKTGSLEYRFALHDLQDPQTGLPQNSQLEFFNFNFRILPGELRFEEMNVFKVLNLNPVNFFESKPSWGVELGLQNKRPYCSAADADCFLSGALLKYGFSRELSSAENVVWGLATGNIRYGADLLDSKYYLAPGFEFGFLHRLSKESSFLLRFAREYPIDRMYEQNYEVQFRHSFFKDVSTGLRVKNDDYGILIYYYY